MADARRSVGSSEALEKASRAASDAVPSRCPRSVLAPAVLVVDDEPVVRNVTARLLTSLGFRPLTAETAHDGLRAIVRGRPRVALVILDVGLPGVGGEEALRLFKASAQDIPVVIASGYTRDDLEERFLLAGATAFLEKPFRRMELAKIIESALHITTSPPPP